MQKIRNPAKNPQNPKIAENLENPKITLLRDILTSVKNLGIREIPKKQSKAKNPEIPKIRDVRKIRKFLEIRIFSRLKIR